jgi:outer membrane receptor for ferrienterochelin and colicins
MEIGAVVVTGTATPHIYEDMPVRTEVIPQKVIQQKQAINLAQALGMQTGIRVENNCSNCNFSQVRILGFDGKYSQILIDGDPVVSSLAGVYGLDHFPQEMILRKVLMLSL